MKPWQSTKKAQHVSPVQDDDDNDTSLDEPTERLDGNADTDTVEDKDKDKNANADSDPKTNANPDSDPTPPILLASLPIPGTAVGCLQVHHQAHHQTSKAPLHPPSHLHQSRN